MSLSDLVDNHEQQFNNILEWNTLLPFIVLAPFLLSNKSPSLFGAKFCQENLFELVLDRPIDSLQKGYFCHQKYPQMVVSNCQRRAGPSSTGPNRG
jgi:hypothetical protein